MIFSFILAYLEHLSKRWPEVCLASFLGYLSLRCYLTYKTQIIANWPIVGGLPYLLKNVYRLHEWSAELSTIGTSYLFKGPLLGRQELLLTCDPRNVEYILKTNFSNFPKGPEYLETLEVLGQGIFSVDSDSWHQQRKMANKAFGAKDFRSSIATMSQKVVEDKLLPLLKHLQAQVCTIDLQDVLLRYSFDSSCAIILGEIPGSLSPSLSSNEFSQAIDDAREVIFFRNVMPRRWWKLLRSLRMGREREVARILKTLDQYMAHYISSKREDLLRGVEANDLLATYMKFHEDRNDMSLNGDKFLRDTVLNFIFAGRDTVASGLTMFFWLVSKNPRVEKKIMEELRILHAKNVADSSRLMKPNEPCIYRLEDLRSLVYLQAALYESMRLYPPVPLNRKGVLKEDVLPDGNVVRPGMQITFSIYAMGRMQSIWGEDCLEFKPERWFGDDGKLLSESKFKYFVFNIGPRTCIGKDMAITQMKLAVAAILFNFHVEVLDGQSASPKPSTILQLKNGLMVKIKHRVA
ncbi:PREDICTED: alkane hydroxylase MAH1-like [Nelumbo nucifera]|uniref:Alkane hydroxylase MAH1-like n=2 Tax=Nelumbo nucifera TaxID=4432 RepID=A0A1U7YTP0_NELNU|nr:PREDICTED: alkane hydroxylase MAH1-like [Nelumbo nucifera]DAD25156.1 TPA_asm: hypothetical protein HUJ06_026620 [Nelumbo nucifera]